MGTWVSGRAGERRTRLGGSREGGQHAEHRAGPAAAAQQLDEQQLLGRDITRSVGRRGHALHRLAGVHGVELLLRAAVDTPQDGRGDGVPDLLAIGPAARARGDNRA